MATSRSGASTSGKARASAGRLADSCTNTQTNRSLSAMISSMASAGEATAAVSRMIWSTGGRATGIALLVDISSSHRRISVAAALPSQVLPSRALPLLSTPMPATPALAPRLRRLSVVRAIGTALRAFVWCTGPSRSVNAALRNRRRGQSAWSFRTASVIVGHHAGSPMRSR